MIAALISWILAFDDGESWKVVSRKQKKSPFFICRKQSFCGEPRGSERPLFQVCCPGPGSVSKESDSGPSFSVFSGGIPGSFTESQLDFIHDPAVKRLHVDLNVRHSGACSPVLAYQRGSAFSCPLSRRQPGFENVGEFQVDRVTDAGAAAALSTGTIGLEGFESHDSKDPAHDGTVHDVVQGLEDVCPLPGVRRDYGRGQTAHATAGESTRIMVASDVVTRAWSFNSSCGSSRACMSYLDAVLSAPARAPAAALVARCSAPSSSAVGLCMHAHGSLVHDACSNSWSDTVRKGPTGRRCTKGGVSGSAEDLLPVSEVEAGVNFRPAGCVRGQVAGSLPRRQPGTGTRRVGKGVVTPSLHPEVPGIQFVSPGRGLDIRQSMGWTKVCETTRSGIWVLKGNARARMLPENLDHLRVRWISR